MGDLDSLAVTIREGGRVFFRDSGAISTVIPVKMILKPVPSPRGTQAAREGALCRSFWKYDVIHLG